jgi:hypothetical protein
LSAGAWWARVAEVGTAADQIGQIRASWPDVGGEYPDWIDHGGSGSFVMPAVGDFVEVIERADEPGRFEWTKIAQRPDRLPAEAKAAHPDVACLQEPRCRCYLVLDGRASIVVLEAGSTIKLGKDAGQPAVLGDALRALFNAHIHQTPVGPSGPALEGALADPLGNPASPSGPHLSDKVEVE